MQVLLLYPQALFLFFPLVLSAALSAIVMHLDLLAALRAPVDCGLTFRGRRLFGDNKTWRGFVIAIVGSTVGVALQKVIPVAWIGPLALVDYTQVSALGFGAAMGCGAMLGELPNSFVKRQLDVGPGETATGWSSTLFFVWDQIDTLTVTWLLLLPWLRPSAALIAMSFAMALSVHPIISYLGYLFGVRHTAR